MHAVNSVLILEDQPDALSMLTDVVKQLYPSATLVVERDLKGVYDRLYIPVDLALIDIRLPDGVSIDWLAQFKSAQPKAFAVVTSLYDDDELVFSAMRAGADGYLLKGEGQEHLAQGLAKAIAGEPPISPVIARKLMRYFLPVQSAPAQRELVPVHLSVREEEVLALIGVGKMIKQVAAQLDISYHTVNEHIKAIYRKLGIRTRAEAAQMAVRRGLV